MDTFELNKMAGAVLLCLLIIMGVRSVAEIVFAVEEPEEPAYVVAGLEEEGPPAGEAEAPKTPPFPVLLANADPEDGARVFRRCQACHTIEQGGENKIGPNLYNVVGADYGHTAGFNYSNAVMNASGTWTYENLNQWVQGPNDFIAGNKMAFAGLDDPEDRANVIAYLRQHTENPPPLPDVPETAQDDGAASGATADGSEGGENAASESNGGGNGGSSEH